MGEITGILLLQSDLLYNIPEIVGIMVWNEFASASYPESFIILVTWVSFVHNVLTIKEHN